MVAAATSLSVLTASLTAFDMGASAADDRLNIKVYMDELMCSNLSSICNEEVTLGTYGVPSSFTTRLTSITGYVTGFYGYHGATLNFSNFAPASDLIETYAFECVSNSDDWADIMINGCRCYGETYLSAHVACAKGTYQHSNYLYFADSLPSFDSNNECALLLTTSNLCYVKDGEHGFAYGLATPSEMNIISRDSDYCRDHDDDSPYAYARSTLAHEIGHLYGVQDHYELTSPTVYNPNCIWGANMESYDVLKNCTICSVCANIIKNNCDMYQHTN